MVTFVIRRITRFTKVLKDKATWERLSYADPFGIVSVGEYRSVGLFKLVHIKSPTSIEFDARGAHQCLHS